MTKKEFIKTSIIALIIIIIVSISIVSVLYFIKNKNDNEETPSSLYSETAIKVMKEKNLYDKINDNYSKTIEIMLENNTFNEKYINEYYEINYTEISNFSKTVNNLLEKTYQADEINYLLSNHKQNLSIILDMDYIDILKFKDITNFDLEKIERYLNYEKDHDYDMKTVVTYVNIGLDLPGYSEYTRYTNEESQEDLTILVNKYHKLPDDYEPDDLVRLSYSGNTDRYLMRKDAAEAFEELTSAAILENVIFYPFSAYRSFKTQSVLYNRYKDQDGEEKADTYSARPGFSEHQLGLAVDIRSNTLSDNLTSEHYSWLLDNSYKYGFIVRYPKGKQYITQYIEEPWHIRYLGVELATKVHDSGLTYDEYYDLYMTN